MKVMHSKEISVSEIYEKDKKLKKEDVKNVMKWIEQQPHLPKISELDTALFLHSCFYNNEITKITIDTYFTVKTLWSDIFGTRNPRDSQVKATMDAMLCGPLPKLSPDGSVVIIVKFVDTDPTNFILSVAAKCFDMITLSYLNQNGPPNGLIIAFDMEGFSFAHFLRMNVVNVKKFLYYLQEAMPIRLKGVHFCNIVSFMDTLLAFIKPFLTEETLKLIFLHTGMDTLYKHIPKDIFPEDYGGTSDSMQVLHEKYKAQLNGNEELFKNQELQIVDESKRAGKPVNIGKDLGMEGTFKRLELD